MKKGKLSIARTILALALASSLGAHAHPQAQSGGSFESRKQQAIDLYRAQKLAEAMPLFEKLHAENPGDVVVLGLLSFTVLANSATFSDPAERLRERARARKLAVEAVAAGDTSSLTKIVLELPEDGSESAFSDSARVQSAMEEGEAAFAKGEFDAAVAAYSRALAFDPRQYQAALFLGDVYFKKNDHAQAAHWFARAIEIDPTMEAAYRYWGDDLVAQGRFDDAREKFLDAVVAEPYNRRSWMGLTQWAQKRKLSIGFPQIIPPGQVEEKDPGHINVTIDPASLDKGAKKNGVSCWFIYTLDRATWHGERFQKEFPGEKVYRHSLREEASAFQLVVDQVKEGLKKKEIKGLDPPLQTLVKLSDQGLLEAYILITRPDAGIVKDYPAYRQQHRDKLRRYIAEWGIHPQ